MEHKQGPQNPLSQEQIDKGKKEILKRKISKAIERFGLAYFGRDNTFSNKHNINVEIDVGSYLEKNFKSIFLEEGIDTENLILDTRPGKSNTYGDGPEGGVGYYTTDVIIRNKTDNEVSYTTNIQDYGEGWSY